MNKTDDPENILRGLGPRPVPREVGERVLQSVSRRVSERRVLSPGLRLFLVASLLLGALSVFIDYPLESRQQRTLEAELNLSPDMRFSPNEDTQKAIAEMLSDFPDFEALPKNWLEWALSRQAEEPSPRLNLNDIKEKIHDN